MSNVRTFKEIEMKKTGDVYALLCLRSTELNKCWLKEPMLFQNICNDPSRVHDCWNLSKTRLRREKICPAPKCCIFIKLVSYMPGAEI